MTFSLYWHQNFMKIVQSSLKFSVDDICSYIQSNILKLVHIFENCHSLPGSRAFKQRENIPMDNGR
jgi:hypothetical protein